MKVAVEGLERVLRNLGDLPISDLGDAESDAIGAAIASIQDARNQLDRAVKARK